MKKIWVDFNERTDDGLIVAVPTPEEGFLTFDVHEPVMAYDGDGNACPAMIAEVHPTWMGLALEWTRFEAARPQIAGQISL